MRLEKSRQLTVSFFLLFFYLSVHGQEGKSYTRRLENSMDISSKVNEDGSLVISYSIPEVVIKSVVNDKGRFYRLAIPGHVSSEETGKPEVPVYSRLINIPSGSEPGIRITGVKSARIRPSGKRIHGILYPAQESGSKNPQRGERPFSIDKNAYKQRGILNSDTVSIVPLGSSRNISLANLYIRPVRYNPHSNSIEIIRSMKIEIFFMESSEKTKSSEPGLLFSESLSTDIINSNLIRDYSDKPVGMLILTDTTFREHLDPLLSWKMQKGFRTKVLFRGAELAGSTYTELRDTIKSIYDSATEENPAPDYLLIVGDVEKIPYYGAGTTGNVTDLYYGEFDGDGDYLPEMYVGRLPVSDTTELKSVIDKITSYEKFEFADTNDFYNNALATSGYDHDHKIYMNGQVRYSVINYLTEANNITEYHNLHPETEDETEANLIFESRKRNIIDTLFNRNGLSFINYSGHGLASGWQHLDFTVDDTSGLKNSYMYPFIISNACETGMFDRQYSFGNRMVLEQDKGAIAFIGCSNDSFWDEDYYWSVGLGTPSEFPVYEGKGPGVFDRLFHTHDESPSEWYYTIGQINFAGNLSVSASTSPRKKYYWETYNVIGDPSLIPIIGKPEKFNIDLPDTLPNGIRTLTLGTDPFSYVAISHFDTLWDASFAGPSGSVTLEMPGLSDDSCLVVITGQNRYPLIKTVYFSEINKEFINLDSTAINDSAGNNNGKADYGESFYLSLSISNQGAIDADSVSVKVTSASEWLTLDNDTAYIGTIPSHSTGLFTENISVTVSGNVPDMSIASVSITCISPESETAYPVDILLHSPVLRIAAFTVNDSETGNGDYVADPGELVELLFTVRNEGSSDASGDFNLTTTHPGITFLSSSVKSGVIKFGEKTIIPVLARLSPGLPQGEYIPMNSSLICSPFNIDKDFTLRVGKVRESFESASFDVLPWLNFSQVPWIITETEAPDGIFSAKSGAINNSEASKLIIRTYYTSDDYLRFRYRVSSEKNYDQFTFSLNGISLLNKSGEVPWSLYEVPVTAGLNKMEWTYKKDQSVTDGEDCAWIDLIDFSASGQVRYIEKDLHVVKISEPVKINSIGQGILTIELVNPGKDTINGFNLAYRVNNRARVNQYFEEKVFPGSDTVKVTFNTRPDLSDYGIYDIKVYSFENGDDYLANDTASVIIENSDIAESLSIFPNPSSDKFNVYINSHSVDRIEISIHDIHGHILYQAQKEIVTGGNFIEISDLILKPALYYLNIKGKRIDKTVPLIRIRE